MENQGNADLSKVRHDINGALSVISNFLNAIIRIELPDDHRECYEAALRSVKKIEGIVNGGVSIQQI